MATNADIAAFAYEKAKFPDPPQAFLMSKGLVNGPDAREAWKLMKQQTGAEDPGWNFRGKFLVDKDGAVSVPGDDVAAAIEALL